MIRNNKIVNVKLSAVEMKLKQSSFKTVSNCFVSVKTKR